MWIFSVIIVLDLIVFQMDIKFLSAMFTFFSLFFQPGKRKKKGRDTAGRHLSEATICYKEQIQGAAFPKDVSKDFPEDYPYQSPVTDTALRFLFP